MSTNSLVPRITHNLRMTDESIPPSKEELFEFADSSLKLDEFFDSMGFYTQNDVPTGFIVVTNLVQHPSHVAEKLLKEFNNFYQNYYQINFKLIESIDLGKKRPSPSDKEYSISKCLNINEDFVTVFTTSENKWDVTLNNLSLHRHQMLIRFNSRTNQKKNTPMNITGTQIMNNPFGNFTAIDKKNQKASLPDFSMTTFKETALRPKVLAPVVSNFNPPFKNNTIRFPENSAAFRGQGTMKTRNTLCTTMDFTKRFKDFSS